MWSDIALFYMGLKRDIRQSVIEKIFAYDSDTLTTHIDKLLIGRLLQAAWHTTQKNKIDGISNATQYIVPTRTNFLSMVQSVNENSDFPEIFADLFVMTLAEYSFGSGFLKDVVLQIFDNIERDNPSQDSVYKMTTLLWASQRFFEDHELRDRINSILDVATAISLSPKEESIILLLLDAIENKNKQLTKTIQKRLRKLAKSNPALFRKILPPPRPRTRKVNSIS